MMKSLLFLMVILSVLPLSSVASEAGTSKINKILKMVVDEKRESSGLVGLGAIVIQKGEVVGLSVSGERKKGSGSLISPSDRWHLGSITKSFTSTMIARLIEKGDLNWNTSIKDVFPDGNNIHVDWNDVTLSDLLTHTSGAKPNFSLWINFKHPNAGIDRMTAREFEVKEIMAQPPQSTPGTTFVYSNVGYTIAGVMAEKKTGRPWEDLIRQEIFLPLGIQRGGFGVPEDAEGKLSQPWGHKKLFGFYVSTKNDNTPIIGPAGSIHLSLNDLALYANEHLQGIQGHSSILKKDSFERLHHPNLNNYAYGWVIGAPLALGVNDVYWHNGSNTTWYALLVVLPELDAAIAITFNDGNMHIAQQSSWEIVKQLVKALSDTHSTSTE